MIFSKDLPISEDRPESCVYWIYHEDKHNDPRKHGYVGVSVKGANFRFNRHLNEAKNGSNVLVHKAIRKYGDKIKVKVLIKADPEFCLLAEYLLRPVAVMKGTWNISAGGGINLLGYKHTEEAKAKSGASHLGRVVTEETREKLRVAHTGRIMSEATKRNMSKANKGKPKNLTAEQLKRKSEALKARSPVTDETKRKIGAAHKGRTLSEDHRTAMSKASKGVPKSLQHAANISKGSTGKPKSEAHVDNMRAAQLELHKEISTWENYKICKDTWANAITIVNHMLDNPKHGSQKVATFFGIKRGFLVSMLRDVQNGWRPLADPKYLSWLEQHKLKETANVLA